MLVFDGDCGFCTASARWATAGASGVLTRPWQTLDLTTIGLTEGFASPLFDTALVFSSIVMYDATGVRQAAGKQAAILNKMMEEFSATHTFAEKRLKELLGHTRLEVLGGALFGILVAMLLQFGW